MSVLQLTFKLNKVRSSPHPKGGVVVGEWWVGGEGWRGWVLGGGGEGLVGQVIMAD